MPADPAFGLARWRERSRKIGGRLGVSDGARTRDILDHNQVLYQLSYAHHAGGGGRPAASVYLPRTAVQ